MIDTKPCRGFGKDLLHLRKSKVMSKEQLSFLLGENVEFVHRLESEKIYPSSHLMQKLAELYQLNLVVVTGRIYCDAQEDCTTLV